MAETAPGEVAEMDFGRLGLVGDPATGRRRVAWSLIIVLAHSRHSFVWPLFHQKLSDVIEGLEAAWAFFRGIPRYLVIDNFPAAVAGPDSLHPRLTRGFLEYAQHHGFIPIRHGFATPGTSPTWSVESSTSVSGSSRAGHSQASAISGLKRSDGVLRSLVSESTAQPAGCLWSSSERKSSRPCYPGTGSPTTLPIGARPRYIPTITSPASTPCIRCHRPYACREAR